MRKTFTLACPAAFTVLLSANVFAQTFSNPTQNGVGMSALQKLNQQKIPAFDYVPLIYDHSYTTDMTGVNQYLVEYPLNGTSTARNENFPKQANFYNLNHNPTN